MWKFISNEPNENESQSEETEIHDDRTQNKRWSITKKPTNHTLQRKRKIIADYSEKYFYDFS